jgi:hyaluronate lyase
MWYRYLWFFEGKAMRLAPTFCLSAWPRSRWRQPVWPRQPVLATSTACFPQRQSVTALRELRSGRWSDIHATQSQPLVSERYLSLALPHAAAVNADGASYSHILLPGASAAQTAAYCGQPAMRIGDKTPQVAAASDAALGLFTAAFWQGGTAPTCAARPSSAAATVIVQEQEQDGQLQLGAADPTQQEDQ